MSLSQILPAITLGAITLTSVPAVVSDTAEALLDVPAISRVVPDPVEAWIQDVIVDAEERAAAPVSKKSATTSAKTTEVQVATREEARVAATPPSPPKGEPVAVAVTPTTKRLATPRTSPTSEVSEARKGEPFGQWVKARTHEGVKGRELAEAIRAEKASRE